MGMESIDKNKKYWFGIFPEIYCVKKQGVMLLYNTKNGHYIQIHSIEIHSMIDKMYEAQNLGVIEVDGLDLMDKDIVLFVTTSLEKKICFLVEKMPLYNKPVQMMPVLNLQRDIDRLQKERERSMGEEIMLYLADTTFRIIDFCEQDCVFCGTYHQQCSHCKSAETKEEMDFILLKNLIAQTYSQPYSRIFLSGGNIFSYSYFDDLIDYCEKKAYYPTLSIHYKNVPEDIPKILAKFPLRIFVSAYQDDELCRNVIRRLGNSEDNEFIFIVSSAKEYETYRILIDQEEVKNHGVVPFYDDGNLDFFKENVYLTEDDILENPISYREIFARQKLNTHFFGSIEVEPNGDVYVPSFENMLGNVHSMSLSAILEKEFIFGTSWRKIRNEAPCTDCLYQFLCPSPSVYERVIGKSNLCHVVNLK